MTRERITKFLNETKLNKSVFCRYSGISVSMLQAYMHHQREISKAMDSRINEYIDRYIKNLQGI